MIDLRSDTVTKPTQEMRDAMYKAEVGDDVYGDDPTVNQLQEISADITGKESALLVSSGTMGNLVSLLALTKRGDEIVLGDKCHVYAWEGAGVPIFGGVSLKVITNQDDGTFDLQQVRSSINPIDDHKPTTSVLSIENTHNQCGGSPLSPTHILDLKNICDKHKLKIHMDGARLFNASESLNIKPSEITEHVDSVTFCLSKGLACPVGSVICGSKDFINEAKRWRKAIGGGMRQAGVFAAAGIVGINRMVDRLSEDHDNAKILALGLEKIDGLEIDVNEVKTNIVRFSLISKDIAKFQRQLQEEGVVVNPGSKDIRMVTHHGINTSHIKQALIAVSNSIKNI